MITSLFVTPAHFSSFLFFVTFKTIHNWDFFLWLWILILWLAKISPSSNERSSACSWQNIQKPSHVSFLSIEPVNPAFLLLKATLSLRGTKQRYHQGSKTANSYSVTCDEQWGTCIKMRLLSFDTTQLPVSLNGEPVTILKRLLSSNSRAGLSFCFNLLTIHAVRRIPPSRRCCNYKVLFNICYQKQFWPTRTVQFCDKAQAIVETASLR